MAKKNKNLLILAILGIFLFAVWNGSFFFLGSSVPQGGTSSVIRQISPSSVTVDQSFTVSLNVDVGSKGDCPAQDSDICNDFYVIEDIAPLGSQVTSISNPIHCDIIDGNPDKVICVRLQNAVDEIISYTVTAPSNPQTATFSGDWMFQGDLGVNQIEGVQAVEVIPAPNCQTSWQCTNWTGWSDSANSCGTRLRICSDNNNCNSNAGKPAETESVTCTSTSSGTSSTSGTPTVTIQGNGTTTSQPETMQTTGNLTIIIALIVGYFIFSGRKGGKK